MWLLIGGKVKTRRIAGGRQVRKKCPKCEEAATFYECEATTSLNVFFVDVLSNKERLMQCGECAEVFGTDELPAATLPEEKPSGLLARASQALSKLSAPDPAKEQKR